MIGRRQALMNMGAVLGGTLVLPRSLFAAGAKPQGKFRFCLNTSTISECAKLDVLQYIEIAAEAGYDGVELWVGDVRSYRDLHGSLAPVNEALQKTKLQVENAIGFAPWLAGDKGMEEMRLDMELMASIGCRRIAAPPVGHLGDGPLDLAATGEQYKKLLALGRETGVMPQLEFWGASPIFSHIGQAAMVVCIAGDPDSRILPDVFHLFKGKSDAAALEMIDPGLIDVFHMNDYLAAPPRDQQSDSDRVYPGDGVAPITQMLRFLNRSDQQKVLSLELFNAAYWKNDALSVARTGLQKMKQVADLANS